MGAQAAWAPNLEPLGATKVAVCADLVPAGWGCRQEDAQEFLSYVMDRMHEELLKLEAAPTEAAPPARLPNGPLANGAAAGAAGGPGEGDDEWETVGPKNKSAVTRMHTHAESALSSIFGGSLQSLVKTKGEGMARKSPTFRRSQSPQDSTGLVQGDCLFSRGLVRL